MLKVIHFRESDLLNLISKNEVTLPDNVSFEPNQKFIVDTECQTALAVVVGVLKFNRYVLRLQEVQQKLFMPFFFLLIFGVFHNPIC